MRVLFTATSGWGHIHPMAPLARAFLDIGDEVLWATGAEPASRLERDGFRAAPAGLAQQEGMAIFNRRFPELHDLPRPEWPDFMFPRLFGSVLAGPMLADLQALVGEWTPDLVVHDAAELAGPIVAAGLDVPNLSHAFGALLPAARVAAAGVEVGHLWSDSGLDPRPHGGLYDHLYIDIYPPSMQSVDRPHVAATQLLSPGSFATSGDEELPDWVTEPSGRPLVYITFGTVFTNDDVLSKVLEAVRDLPTRVVVTVGPQGDPAGLGPQPDNVHVARYIPQDRLLAHCAAVVSHAGSGTFLAALAAGLPQLCLPQAADQFLNAAACARSGVGLNLGPDDVSVDKVRESVERLLSDGAFRAAAQRGSDDIAAMPSAREVAQRLHADHA
ncbi:MAG: glycosyltransferase [Acidimicrobiales bacterium]